MRTVYMGEGKVIVSMQHHPKIKGRLMCFNKNKKTNAIPTNNVDAKDIGRGIVQIYFPDRKSLERFRDHIDVLLDEWRKNEIYD